MAFKTRVLILEKTWARIINAIMKQIENFTTENLQQLKRKKRLVFHWNIQSKRNNRLAQWPPSASFTHEWTRWWILSWWIANTRKETMTSTDNYSFGGKANMRGNRKTDRGDIFIKNRDTDFKEINLNSLTHHACRMALAVMDILLARTKPKMLARCK